MYSDGDILGGDEEVRVVVELRTDGDGLDDVDGCWGARDRGR